MPSPVGHALAGVALGSLAAGRSLKPRGSRARPPTFVECLHADRSLITFGTLGVLPDIDFFIGMHSMHTHSIGAIVIVGVFAFVWDNRRRARRAVALASAYGSHVLLDWLGSDSVAPIGIMALWPLGSDFYLSDHNWFLAICRQYWLADCWYHNAVAVLREVIVLGIVATSCVWLRLRTGAVNDP